MPGRQPVIRPACGTAPGLLAHQGAGERLCGWCVRAEAVTRLGAEGIASRLPPAGWLPPVTPGQAAANAAALDAELRAWEQAHPRESRTRYRHLRPVA